MTQLNEFCVVSIKDQSNNVQLHCFYSSKTAQALDKEKFESHLKQLIPQYMIPSTFKFMHELPHTSSGKIDRVFLANQAIKEDTNGS